MVTTSFVSHSFKSQAFFHNCIFPSSFAVNRNYFRNSTDSWAKLFHVLHLCSLTILVFLIAYNSSGGLIHIMVSIDPHVISLEIRGSVGTRNKRSLAHNTIQQKQQQ